MANAAIRRISTTTLAVLVCLAVLPRLQAQAPTHYEPTLESLNKHPLPQWYADAKLGIFVHWGLYSVPGWAPLNHPDHDFTNADYIKYNPYAEWYLNVVRIDGSPTQAYDKEHFGANHNYYDFAQTFDKETQEVGPQHLGKDLPRCRRQIRRPYHQASRWLHALAKFHAESDAARRQTACHSGPRRRPDHRCPQRGLAHGPLLLRRLRLDVR